MPRRTRTKPARIATRSVAGGKPTAKKTKAAPNGSQRLNRKEMRFSVSLVILIGMLSFSLLLLLVSLNKPAAADAGTRIAKTVPAGRTALAQKTGSRIVDDSSLDFKVTVPAGLGQWSYKTGEVKSLTDDSLSDRYLQILVPIPGAKSNNLEEQNGNILTIRRFSEDEWDDAAAACKKDKKDICDAAGALIGEAEDPEGDSWTYAYTKSSDCPKSIEAKCNLADKIVESFQLK